MKIRPLVLGDRMAVARILMDSRVFSTEEARIALEMVDAGLAEGPENGYALFVAELKKTVCGYVCIGRTPLTASTWHLYWIGVHPQVQRQGVGRALQAHIEQYIRCRNGTRVVLETSGRPDYERSRRFYDAIGYQVAGRISDYYKPGDDCVFYYKVLS